MPTPRRMHTYPALPDWSGIACTVGSTGPPLIYDDRQGWYRVSSVDESSVWLAGAVSESLALDALVCEHGSGGDSGCDSLSELLRRLTGDGGRAEGQESVVFVALLTENQSADDLVAA